MRQTRGQYLNKNNDLKNEKLTDFSIIIPVHNEEQILKGSICRLYRTLRPLTIINNWEIILIENSSSDNSWQLCQNLAQQYSGIVKAFNIKIASYGVAIKQGILKAKFNHIFIFNVDFWDTNFLKKGLLFLQTCDILVGSKTLIAAKDMRPMIRRQISYWFNVLLRAVYNYPGTDTHGLKAIKSKTILPLVHSCYPMHELFDTQLILRACKQGMDYREIPIKVREIRPSRYEFLRRSLNLFKDLLTIFEYRYLK